MRHAVKCPFIYPLSTSLLVPLKGRFLSLSPSLPLLLSPFRGVPNGEKAIRTFTKRILCYVFWPLTYRYDSWNWISWIWIYSGLFFSLIFFFFFVGPQQIKSKRIAYCASKWHFQPYGLIYFCIFNEILSCWGWRGARRGEGLHIWWLWTGQGFRCAQSVRIEIVTCE